MSKSRDNGEIVTDDRSMMVCIGCMTWVPVSDKFCASLCQDCWENNDQIFLDEDDPADE